MDVGYPNVYLILMRAPSSKLAQFTLFSAFYARNHRLVQLPCHFLRCFNGRLESLYVKVYLHKSFYKLPIKLNISSNLNNIRTVSIGMSFANCIVGLDMLLVALTNRTEKVGKNMLINEVSKINGHRQGKNANSLAYNRGGKNIIRFGNRIQHQ